MVDPATGTTTYTYDDVGNLKTVTFPNGTIAEYTYDTLNRLTSLENRTSTGSIISSYTYTLDAAGNRTKVEEHTGRMVDYTYDVADKLLEERITAPDGSVSVISYTYDAVGNRLTKTDNGFTTTYEYDDNNRLRKEDDVTYHYDDNGNLTRKDSAEEEIVYSYDNENHLIRVDTTRFGSTIVVEYAYDATGNRIRKTIDGTITTTYLVDENRDYAQVLEERDGDGNLLVRYVYGHDLISQTRPSAGSGTDTTYYHYDGLGSTRALTAASEAVTDSYTYDAFGNLLDKTGTTTNTHLYTGEFFDSQTGFYYLRARYMNPAIGRFVTRDPFAGFQRDPYSLHKYLYAHANPVNMVDPSGYLSAAETAYVGMAIGAIASWHVYNVTHQGDEWSFRECFVWTGWGAMTGGLAALALVPASLPLANEASQKILNLGSGDNPLQQEGVVNVDMRVLTELDVVADANSLPFATRLFDKIISQNPRFHLLTSDALRVLKPGGRLYAVGNFSNKFFSKLLKVNPADYGLKLIYSGPASEELLFGTMKHTTGQAISSGAIEKMQQVVFEKL